MSRKKLLTRDIEKYDRYIDTIAEHLDNKIERKEEFNELDKALDEAFTLSIIRKGELVKLLKEGYEEK